MKNSPSSEAENLVNFINQIDRKDFSFALASKTAAIKYYNSKILKRLPDSTVLAVKSVKKRNAQFRILENIIFEQIEGFLDGVANGTIEAELLSAADPGHMDNLSWKIATTNTLQKIVLNETFDTFLLISTTWCGHCTSIKKVLIPLAEDLANKTVHFYNFDADENDIPEWMPENRGYPTIYLWPMGKKGTDPIPFTGGSRTYDDFSKFLIDNCQTQLTPSDFLHLSK